MKLKRYTTSRVSIFLAVATMALLLTGCGNDEKPVKPKEKKGILQKDPSIYGQISQVTLSLENLKKQVAEQERQITQAQEELDALRKTLASHSLKDLATTTSDSAETAAERRPKGVQFCKMTPTD
jgi:hypothetical protein